MAATYLHIRTSSSKALASIVNYYLSNRYVASSLQQPSAVTLDNGSSQILVLHSIQIRLGHILWRAHLPDQTPILESLQDALEPLLRDITEQLRIRRTRADQVDPQRRQIHCKAPCHALEARAPRSNSTPALDRSVRIAPAGKRNGGSWPRGHVRRSQLRQHQ